MFDHLLIRKRILKIMITHLIQLKICFFSSYNLAILNAYYIQVYALNYNATFVPFTLKSSFHQRYSFFHKATSPLKTETFNKQ